MTRNQTTLALAAAVIVLLFATQLLSGMLSLLSFERGQLQTVLSGYDAIGNDLVAKIERALRFGKPLEKFIGIEAYLKQGSDNSPSLSNLMVLGNDGRSLFRLKPAPLPVWEKIPTQPEMIALRNHFRQDEDHFLFYPLRNGEGLQVGWLALSFQETALKQQRTAIFLHCFQGLAVVTGTAILLLGGYFLLFGIGSSVAVGYGRTFRLVLFLLLGGAQLTFSLYSARLFEADYLRLTEDKALVVAKLLKQDVEELLRRGLQLKTLHNIDKQLAETVNRTSEIAYLALSDEQGETRYQAGQSGTSEDTYRRTMELQGKTGVVGQIVMFLDEGVVSRAVEEIVWDSLTVALLSMLFCFEIVTFLLSGLLLDNSGGRVRFRGGEFSHHARIAVFLFIFSATLGHSFLTLQMSLIYQPLLGLSRDLVIGLPLALEMLGGGLVLIPAGRWIDNRGWHEAFLTGVGLSAVGSLFSGLANTPELFIVSRFVSGCGYGLAWMAGQGYVLLHTPEKRRAQGISLIVAGIFAGIICGNGMGALLAERLGYAQVFYLGAIGMILALCFPLVTMRPSFIRPKMTSYRSGAGKASIFRLLKDGQAMLVFGCSLLPYSVVMVGLLYYIVPVYLKNTGAGQADIGRIIMLFGLCMIFVAPRVSRLADRRPDKRLFVVIGGLLAAGSLLSFLLPGSFWQVALAVFLFGLSVSVSAASRNVITLALPVAREVGMSQVMGLYRTVDKLGQTLGALVPGTLMMVLSLPDSVAVMGAGYLLVTLLLFWRLRNYMGGESTRKS